MCVYSAIGDYWKRDFPERWPDLIPYTLPNHEPNQADVEALKRNVEELRKEIEELKKLLAAAKEYDRAMGEPDCEVDEKTALIKKLADLVGVDLKGVLD